MPEELATVAEAAARTGAESGEDALLTALLVEVERGSERALERLYRRLSGPVFGLALWRTGCREDAADVVQETFLRIALRRRTLGGVRRPRVWVLTIAHRLAVDATRRRARFARNPDEELLLVEAPPDDPGRALDAARATRLLASLPPAQREAVFLHLFEGLSFSAIGDVTGAPTFTAASRYRLAIARLRRAMEARP